MADFTVRVELHGASDDHYKRLHAKMQEFGFSRWIGTSAGKWALPTAEYNMEGSTLACTAVRDMVKVLADGILPGAWVLVSDCTERAWSTAKI